MPLTFMAGGIIIVVMIDKVAHASVSALIVISLEIVMPLWLSILTAIMIGIAKEVYDKINKKGCADWKDLVADFIGVILGFSIVLIS